MYKITKHAKERMSEYNVDEYMVKQALNNPEHILAGNKGRKIYQKKLNGYLLRVIIEEEKEIKTVVTLYKARKSRYGI